MKFAVSLVAILLAFTATTDVMAQNKNKFGHIDSQKLLEAMPERKAAQEQMIAETKKLEMQLQAMSTEYQTKMQEYQALPPDSVSPLIRQFKEEEIINLQNRIQNFQAQADEALVQKETELLKPIIDKAKAAIKAVSDSNGYTYVFDTSGGTVLQFPDGDNILPLVLKYLGLPETVPTADGQ